MHGDRLLPRIARNLRRQAFSRRIWTVLMLGVLMTLLIAVLLAGLYDSAEPVLTVVRSWVFQAFGAVCVAVLAWVTATRALSLSRRLRSQARPTPQYEIDTSEDPEQILARLPGSGWRRTQASQPGDVRLVRQVWARWSGIALHAGLTLVALAAVVISATTSEGLLVFSEGDVIPAGSSYTAVERGPLTGPFVVPEQLRLKSVTPEWWPSGELRDVTSVLVAGSDERELRIGVNQVNRWQGVRLFQTTTFGRALTLEITPPDGEPVRFEVELRSPQIVGEPSYRDVEVPGVLPLVRMKYTESLSGTSTAPLATVRLESNGAVVGQQELTEGVPASVGAYTVTLTGVRYWSQVIVSDQAGGWLLGLGFALVAAGGLGLYLGTPAEIYLAPDGSRYRAAVVFHSRFGTERARASVITAIEEPPEDAPHD
jgi:cytochrome c biogenesis protein